MSEQASEASSPPPAATPRRHRWRRRIVVALAILAVISIIARVVVNIALPSVLRRIASSYDLTCNYERSEMNLLSGDAALWHLSFTPKSGGDPVLSLDYVRGNISTLALLRGRLDVWRMEADGVDVRVERMADGHIPLLDEVLANPLLIRAKAAPAKSPSSSTQVDFTPPLALDAFRLSHVRARILDHTVSPATDATVTLNLRVSDVQSTVRPITFEMDVWTDPILDLFRVEGTANTTETTLDADIHMIVHGLHPRELENYLKPLGVQAVARSIAMEGRGQVKLVAISTTPSAPNQPKRYDALSGEMNLHDISIKTDSQEAVGVDHVQIKADSISLDAAKFADLLVEGVRLSAGTGENGVVQFAGFQIAPGIDSSSATTQPVRSFAIPSTLPSINYRVALGQASLRKVHAAFEDRSTTSSPAKLGFDIDELTAKDLAFDPNKPDAIVSIDGTMSAPAIAQSIVVAAKVAPFAPKTKTLTLSVNVNGIKPDAAKPYLDAAGFKSELKQGSFTAEINGELTQGSDGRYSVSGQVSKLRFADGSELLAMNDVKLNGIGMDAQTGALRIDAIDISGPNIVGSRDASGAILLVGFRSNGPIAMPRRAPSTAPSPPPSNLKLISLPKLQIGRFTWKDVKVQFNDEMVSPPASITLADAGVEVHDLVIGESQDPQSTKPGTVKAWLSAPGVIQSASIEGSVNSLANGAATDVQVNATGVTAIAIKSYLAALGIEPQLEDGRLQLHAKASVKDVDGGLGASLDLQQVSWMDGNKELAGADAVRIQEATLKPNELNIGAVELDRPRASVARDAQGVFSAGGVKLLLAPSTQPAGAMPELPVAVLKRLRINDGVLGWSDQVAGGSVNTSGHATVQLDGLTLGRDAEPATFTITASADGIIEHSQLAGKLTTSPQTQGIEMDCSADGVKIGPLAPYLPPGIQVPLRDGRLRANISASISANPQGGHSAKISVRDASIADGADSPALLKLDSFSAIAPRVDPAGGVIDIDQIVVDGFETDIRQTADGAIHLPAVILASAPGHPTTKPVPVAPPTTGPAQDVAARVAAAHRPPPLVTLNQLNVGVSHVSIQSEVLPGSAPVVLHNLHIRNINRVEVGGPDSASRPPSQFEVVGELNPMADSFKITAQIAPLAQQPTATVDVSVSGIHGDGLTKLAPQLQSYIDGSQLTAGTLKSHLELTGKFARHGPAEFDFSKPFDLEVQANGTEYRAVSDGPILAGLEAAHADVVHVDPATGSVQVKTLEITKPIGNIWREKDGIHAFGWVVKVPLLQSGEPTTAPEVASTAPAVTASAAPVAAAAKPPEAEIRIDKVLMSGLDLRLEDRSVDPPVVMPLNGMDVEVRGLSNMVLYQDRPILFSALVTSAKTPLPSPKKGNESQMEDRELFSQVTASGRFSLYPKLDGWAKGSVNGFELLSLRGLAHSQGVTLGKGIFDGKADLRFRPEGVIDVKSKAVFTDLEISEPPGGFIQRTFKLSAPLDVVIKALQDPDESINVPLNFPIEQGNISTGSVVGAAIGAFASVTVTAIASMPVKAASGVTDMFGMGGKKSAERQPVELTFAAGAVDLGSSNRRQLDQLKQEMNKDKNLQLTLRHVLGGSDLARTQIMANPSVEECQNLAYQLRNRKMELLAERSSVAGEASGTVAAAPNSPDATQILDYLRDLDRQLAQTEDGLDNVYDLLKPGAELQADRRTRAASLELAQQRLNAVTAYLGMPVTAARGTEPRVNAPNPTFAIPDDSDSAGKIVITIIAKKKQ